MKQTIEIEVPDGKKAVWKDNKVVFEDIKPQLPKTWEEFCLQNKMRKGDCFISEDSEPVVIEKGIGMRDENFDRNILPSEKAAKAHLALMQLHQLRDCYRDGWLPNGLSDIHGIEMYYDPSNCVVKVRVIKCHIISKFLSFQTEERAKEFLNNFRDLIEQAWDLI